jgi:autotransporter-associated beta strand protein
MTWEVHKFDSGTWTINSAGSDYTGTTHVGAGTLALGAAGAIPHSAVIQVDTSATFDVSAPSGFMIGSTAAQTLKGDGAVTGDVNFASGSGLAVDYSSTAIDSLSVSGALNIANAAVDFNNLGGTLAAGAHVFASYGSLTGSAFASVLDLPSGFSIDYHYLGGNQIALVGTPLLAGDYNGDGKVNGADYVMWRNDPDAFGGAAGYNAWRGNYGAGSGSGLGGSAAVPETATWVLGIIACLVHAVASRKRLHRGA